MIDDLTTKKQEADITFEIANEILDCVVKHRNKHNLSIMQVLGILESVKFTYQHVQMNIIKKQKADGDNNVSQH